MKKRLIAPTLLALLAVVSAGGARADVMELGSDPANDWGDPDTYPIGDALGQELVGAAIDNTQEGTAVFIIRLKSLPGAGGIPEGTRYIWAMKANGKHVELDGKFTNYSRGTCDPTAGTCGAKADVNADPPVTVTPPRDPGSGPFMIRGNCTTTGATLCQEVALVHATFDPTIAEIRVPVPVHLLASSGCAVIEPGASSSFPSQNVLAISSAWFSQNDMPHDWILFEDPEAATVSVC